MQVDRNKPSYEAAKSNITVRLELASRMLAGILSDNASYKTLTEPVALTALIKASLILADEMIELHNEGN